MLPQSSSDLLTFAIEARALGNVDEARAAALAAVRLAPERAEAWLLLLEIEAAEAEWNGVLAAADAGLEHHPADAAIATYRGQAFFNLGRHLEALSELKRIVRDRAGALEALDLLARISAPFDPFTCLAAVEQAVAEGMVGRDHLLLGAADAAALVGEFERGERLVAAIADGAARDRAAAKIAGAAAAWRGHARDYDARVAAGTLPPVWELVDAGDLDFARYAGTRRLIEQCSAHEHLMIVAMCHRLGIVGAGLLMWAAYSTQRHVGHPTTLLQHVDVLLAIGAFADAGAILRTFAPGSIADDDLLRRQVFCCACGGLDAATVLGTAQSAGKSARGAVALALAFLARSDEIGGAAGAFDPQDPRTAALRADPDESPERAVRRFYVPRRSKRPTVALCLSGQLRSFRQTWPQTRAALAPWEPVVFVSTWSGVGAGFGAHDSVERCLPPAVRDRLPAELRRRTLFEAALPRVAAVMAASDEVTHDELREFYGTDFVRVHDEVAFEREHDGVPGLKAGNSLNQAKMFFTMADVSALRSANERHCHRMFDAVLRVRPDRAISYLGRHDVATAATSRTILSDYFMAGAVGDQGMLSGSEVADRLGEIWPRMKAAGNTRFFSGSRGLFNEFLIGEYMMHCGVGIRKFVHTHSMGLTPMVATLAPQWAAILADLGASADLPPDVRTIFAAFCEAVAQEHAAGGDASLLRPLPGDLAGRVAPELSAQAQRFLQASPRG